MLELFLDSVVIATLIALIVLVEYIDKHDFNWSFDKWFIHIKLNVETVKKIT